MTMVVNREPKELAPIAHRHGTVRKGSNTNPFTQKCVVKLSVPVCNKELGVEKGTARTTPVKSVAVVASVGEFFCVN